MNKNNDDKQPVDIITDYGKGIVYKSKDGRQWATAEEVEAANKEYFDALMIEKNDNIEEERPKYHR